MKKHIGKVSIGILLFMAIVFMVSLAYNARAVPRVNVRNELERLIGMTNLSASFGTEYWVDAVSGSDTNTGLLPRIPFASIVAAVTASNLTAGGYNMNTIYIAGSTYTESLTTFPNNCNVIGVGAKVRIQGVQNTGGNGHNSHWWNIQFRNNSSAPIITVQDGDHGFELHGCRLDDQGACTMALLLGADAGGAQDIVIDNCQLGWTNPPPIGIRVAGSGMNGLKITNNQIFAITTGIDFTTAVGNTARALVKGNVIEKGAADGFITQLAYGIKFNKTNGVVGIFVVDNFISADDAIYFAYTDTQVDEWVCINNYIVQGATGDTETDMSD